jgi:hypothetical protein
MCSSKVRYTFSSTIEPAARSELGDIMTDRMMFFRLKQKEKDWFKNNNNKLVTIQLTVMSMFVIIH